LPHFPFVETLIVEVGVAEEDVRVELDEVDVRVDVTRDEEVVRMLELELDALVEELVCAALEVVRTLLALELALLELRRRRAIAKGGVAAGVAVISRRAAPAILRATIAESGASAGVAVGPAAGTIVRDLRGGGRSGGRGCSRRAARC
jgi:hypothetical protein